MKISSKRIFASIDIGNKNLKVYRQGMDAPVLIPNVLCDATTLNTSTTITNLLGGNTNTALIDAIDVEIFSNGKELGRKYIGNKAIIHGGDSRALDSDKCNDKDVLFTGLAGLAYALYQPDGERVQAYTVPLGTCLPINEYLYSQKIEKHEKRFIGTHHIKFHDPAFKGAEVIIHIKQDYLFTGAEGMMALINVLTDEEGNVLPEYENIEEEGFLVGDIGGGTIDLSAIIDYEPVNELIRGISEALLHCEARILNAIQRDDPRKRFTLEAIDKAIRDNNCIIKYRGQNIDISGYVIPELTRFANQSANEINNVISQAPLRIKQTLSNIILTGGSVGIGLISQTMKDKLKDKYNVIVSSTPLYDNVMGAYKSIVSLVREMETEKENIFEIELPEKA